jgi:hypothetical protein
MKMKPTWILLGLWGVVALLAYYRTQSPSPTMDMIYSVAFAFVLILSMIHLFRRARKRSLKDE